ATGGFAVRRALGPALGGAARPADHDSRVVVAFAAVFFTLGEAVDAAVVQTFGPAVGLAALVTLAGARSLAVAAAGGRRLVALAAVLGEDLLVLLVRRARLAFFRPRDRVRRLEGVVAAPLGVLRRADAVGQRRHFRLEAADGAVQVGDAALVLVD